MISLELPKWYDLHAHFRQGIGMRAYVKAHADMACAGILAMPNTKPPVSRVLGPEQDDSWSIEYYLQQLNDAGADEFDDVIVPLYLTRETTPHMIEEGAASGVLRACKYYPPHGTTNADFGAPLSHYIENGVLKAMADHGVVLCVHGEEHGISGSDYFDKNSNAEDIFYRERLPCARDSFPHLKIACEHVTTKTAADFVKQSDKTIGATITPQHLLYTVADLLKGLKYHLYCLPLLKFEEDRQALLDAVTDPANTQFYAGTDSAPHTTKATDCGCAAGCFTGGIAPQLYAQGFEEGGADLGAEDIQSAFKNFLCLNGPAFYGLSVPDETFVLEKEKQAVEILETDGDPVTPLPVGLGLDSLPWRIRHG